MNCVNSLTGAEIVTIIALMLIYSAGLMWAFAWLLAQILGPRRAVHPTKAPAEGRPAVQGGSRDAIWIEPPSPQRFAPVDPRD